mgnify:FL=1
MQIFIMIITVILFVGAIIFAIFKVIKTLQKTDPNKVDTSISDDITTAQDFLPFDDIKDNVIDLGGHNYRAIIECSSTNYNLKTDKEKDIIEASFQRFLNSLTFPITLFIQTRIMDNTKILNQLEEDIKTVIVQYPNIEEYANNYYQEMSNLQYYMQNNKQKKKYIIVPYNEAINMSNLTDEEKYEYSLGEIRERALIVADGLVSVGVKTNILDTSELIELIYSSYHKDNYSNYENIVSGEQLTLIVTGEKNPEQMMSNDERIDWILHEAQERIKNEIIDKPISPKIREEYEDIVKKLKELNIVQ